MEQEGYTFSLKPLELEPSVADLFWKEKVARAIKEDTSITRIQEVANLLLDLSVQRQGVIRGLVKEILTTKNVVVPDSEIANPDITSQET